MGEMGGCLYCLHLSIVLQTAADNQLPYECRPRGSSDDAPLGVVRPLEIYRVHRSANLYASPPLTPHRLSRLYTAVPRCLHTPMPPFESSEQRRVCPLVNSQKPKGGKVGCSISHTLVVSYFVDEAMLPRCLWRSRRIPAHTTKG